MYTKKTALRVGTLSRNSPNLPTCPIINTNPWEVGFGLNKGEETGKGLGTNGIRTQTPAAALLLNGNVVSNLQRRGRSSRSNRTRRWNRTISSWSISLKS